MRFNTLPIFVISFISLLILPTICISISEKYENNKEFLKDINDIEEFLKAEYSKNRIIIFYKN
jgi:hypothetical protein